MRLLLIAGAIVCMLAVASMVYSADYIISQEDVLLMSVWGEPSLTQVRLVVGPDGNLNVPMAGVVKAEGLTVDQLAEAIKKAFRDKQFLGNARVQLLLTEMHRPTISVLGNVNRPGKFEFKEGDTVMEAIAQAGSYQETASLANATLTRKTGEVISLDLYKLYNKADTTQNLLLKKGDTIYVPEETTRRVYVLGEVLRPGMYALKENMTALSAVSQAGGATPDRGHLKGTMVVRGDPANPEKIKVDISKMIGKGDLNQDIPLMAGDLVYVPKSNKPKLQDVSAILSVLTNFRYLTQGLIRR
ncbi:MAG: SLBB domain-containing protein [Armatimonadota bacterium]|nr:SLBB domain-containing protein [Armatimonadota bacterium]